MMLSILQIRPSQKQQRLLFLMIMCAKSSAFATNTNRVQPRMPHLITKQPLSHQTNTNTISRRTSSSSSSKLNLHAGLLSIARGGAAVTPLAVLGTSTPSKLFNTSLLGIALSSVFFRIFTSRDKNDPSGTPKKVKPAAIRALQTRFLAVFWLLRCADWLQGPYFYEVYASKLFNGVPPSLSLISQLFLTGFASTALFGPLVGRAADTYGRKKATLAFSMIYSIGALSTKSPILKVLLLGRVLSGIGTSLLFSAPESWLVGDAMTVEGGGDYLGETFGLAYAGDSIVAIIAGQLAATAASTRGPTGPFELSTVFLVLGGILASFLWKENVASNSDGDSTKVTIRDAFSLIAKDKKIAMVGATQALFEAAMYIFVLQWPPAITAAIGSMFGEGVATPYGTVFSCFMASCLLGSSIFSKVTSKASPSSNTVEKTTSVMLALATLGMTSATFLTSGVIPGLNILYPLMASFFVFEACVGMYFPSIGTLRSKYIPDSHRGVIMNLFGIPLNALVVSVFLSIKFLGVNGALGVSSLSLGLATASMLALRSMIGKKEEDTSAAIA